ncbi:diaminobutyrate acetyltransferase [Roseovarius pacificus]|uniref:L-2,4-diaminobutyric acid acetyltransferase n=1 Tax=Roseovarius pacificus TaxID=337701 RepID=A0A1M7G6C9_9RHOB|nr:diaminobutyrate acetyltransferase [Roseovarius pacificus]GGO59666.1 L-2,4-diaminobutyric acid acetyltransferase [Roseovarius pacificus]SHM11638.1 diaminobutyrate acetyltransferase [Roseovarius pacificus]
MHKIEGSKQKPQITFRKPGREDGSAIWDLIASCHPLDENSMYCNLIQCDHFSDTCVLAEMNGEPVGWISAYRMPDDLETLFVWQVAVSEKARGQGLGTRMLEHLVEREDCDGVNRLQTTITLDNDASWALFGRFSTNVSGKLTSQPYFQRDHHFDGRHATEHMVTIRFAEELKRAA